MNRKILIPASLLAIGALAAGCAATTASADGATEAVQAQTTSALASSESLATDDVMSENADYSVLGTDEWSESDAVDIVLSGTEASSDGDGVSIDRSTVTITAASVYRLTGTLDGAVIVDAPEDADVVLILDDATVTNADGAAIEIREADDVAIHLADGSVNAASDAAEYDEDADANAAISSDADLTISGSGELTVTGTGGHGIKSTDDLVILGGTITVNSAEDALRGKDALVVEGGDLTLTSTNGDGMKSKGDDGDADIDWTQGYVYVAGGTIDITAGDDGIQAFTDVVIAGGTITADVADDGIKGEAIVTIGEDDAASTLVTVTSSYEAIEAANIEISGGVIDVTASDDGINASGNAELQALINGTEYSGDGGEFADTGERLEITGGTVTVDAEGDGLDSNGSLTITGGDIVVYGPTTGGNGSLDADGEITVDGGTLVAFGPGSMEETPGSGEQDWVLVSAPLSAGDTAQLVSSDGTVIAEQTAEKNATTVIFSSSDIVAGETYTVTVGGEEIGSAVAGEGGAGGMGGGPGGMEGGFDGQAGPGEFSDEGPGAGGFPEGGMPGGGPASQDQ